MITDTEKNYIVSGENTVLGRYLVAELRKCAPMEELTLFFCAATECDTTLGAT